MILLVGIAVFASAAVYDFVNASYLSAVADADSSRAARLSVLTYAVGLLGFIGIFKISMWLVVPEAMGLAVGTYAAVEYRAFKTREDQ